MSKNTIPALKEKSLSLVRAGMKVLDDEAGIVEMIVSVYSNIDSFNERMIFGCYAKSLAIRNPNGLFSHNWEKPVAKTLEAKELKPNDAMLPPEIKMNGGLYIKAQYNLDTERGHDAFSDLKNGIIGEFSVGYEEIASEWNKDLNCKDVTEAFLYEWSSVVAGANPATSVISAKALGQKLGHQVFDRVKAEFLGACAENQMTYSAMCELGYSLMWELGYEACFGTAMSKADRIAMFCAGCDEFRDLCAAQMLAMLPEENTVGSTAMTAMQAEVTEHKTLLLDQKSLRFRDGTQFKTALDALSELGTRVKSELTVIAELRAIDRKKSGRVFSSENEAKLTQHVATLRATAKEMEGMLVSSAPAPEDIVVNPPEKAFDAALLHIQSQQLLMNSDV